MVFGLFMAGEYMAIMFMCGLFSTAFLGGYQFFGLEDLVLANGFAIGRGLGLLFLLLKSSVIFFLFMWIRGTLPRFRIDQLLNFNWKFMVPLTLVLLLSVALLDRLIVDYLPGVGEAGRAGIHFASNIVIGLAGLEVVRRAARRQRQQHINRSSILAIAENEGEPIAVIEAESAQEHHEPVPVH
jgi:NADH-quinone oxidoreductase subunit H